MGRRFLAEDGGRCVLPMSQTEESFVLRVQIEQQSIVGPKRVDDVRAGHRKEQDGVGAVSVRRRQSRRALTGPLPM